MGFEKYRVVMRYDSEAEEFVATVPELPSFEEQRAASRGELVDQLDDALDAAAQKAVADDGALPTPIDDRDSQYDGTVVVDVGVSLHRELAHRAVREKLSVSQLAVNVLAMYVGGGLRSSGGSAEYRGPRNDRERGPGRGRDRRGQQGYHQVMEDKASFMEYVRQQERTYGSGGAPRPRRRRGGGTDED